MTDLENAVYTKRGNRKLHFFNESWLAFSPSLTISVTLSKMALSLSSARESLLKLRSETHVFLLKKALETFIMSSNKIFRKIGGFYYF